MTVTKPWLARWAIALGLAATLTVWPLGCAPDEHSDIPEPPPGAELARLSDTLKDMDGKVNAYLSDVGYKPGDARKDGLITGIVG